MLEGRNLEVSYGGFKALDQVTVTLKPGTVTGLIGPNGAGKSTLFSVLAGSIRPRAGEVLFDARPITNLYPAARARLGLGRSFQLSRDLAGLTVLENLLIAARSSSHDSVFSALFRRHAFKREQEENVEKARRLLGRVDLWRLADSPSNALSGGQKKLLDLCRVLMSEPKLILLDEPSAGVNPTRIGEITEFIQALRDEGITFGMVEHNMKMIKTLCDHVYALAEGRVISHGRFDDVVSNDDVANAYLGYSA